MKAIDKILYLRAIWFVIVGVVGIAIGFRTCTDEPKLDELRKIDGRITNIQKQKLFSRETKTNMNSIVIYVDSVFSAYTYYSKNLAILDTVSIKIGDFCQILAEEEIRKNRESGETIKYKIRALTLNDKSVITFQRHSFFAIYYLLYVLIILVPALIFVIKHPEILFGKRKSCGKIMVNETRQLNSQ